MRNAARAKKTASNAPSADCIGTITSLKTTALAILAVSPGSNVTASVTSAEKIRMKL